MTSEPTTRALRRLRGDCAITTTTRVGYARADIFHEDAEDVAIETCQLWPATDPEILETVALRILWHHLRQGLTMIQARRLVELVDLLRADHGGKVNVHGSATVSVHGSSIGARIERDGSVWYSWADGSKSYDQGGPLYAPIAGERFPTATGPGGMPYSPNGMAGDPEPAS